MSRLFGTDGVRGVANEEFDIDSFHRMVYIFFPCIRTVFYLSNAGTRISSDMLANALMAGACAVGANCVYVGVLPTPAIAYLTFTFLFSTLSFLFIPVP